MKNRIYLRAFEISDLETLNKLRNDEDSFLYTLGNKYYISKEYDKKWIEDKIFNNSLQIYLAICLDETKEIIGYTSINDIDYRNRKAQWGGIVIDKNYAGKGIATDVGKQVLTFVFEEIGLNRLYAFVNEIHKASLRMTEKLGFKNEGIMRDFSYKQNRFHNAIILSILKKEYDKVDD